MKYSDMHYIHWRKNECLMTCNIINKCFTFWTINISIHGHSNSCQYPSSSMNISLNLEPRAQFDCFLFSQVCSLSGLLLRSRYKDLPIKIIEGKLNFGVNMAQLSLSQSPYYNYYYLLGLVQILVFLLLLLLISREIMSLWNCIPQY